MIWYVLLAFAFVIGLIPIVNQLRGMRLGDLIKVEIPRDLSRGDLAQGTRIDILAALQKSGVDKAELRRLADADDSTLIKRYWAMKDAKGPG